MPTSTFDVQTLQTCAAIRRGNESAFTEFYEDWISTLTAWSLEYTRSDESLALDIVQETMIRVIRSIPVLESHAALVAWLRAATRSSAIDLLRKRIAIAARERAVAKPETDLEPPPSIGTELESLLAALATLSPEDRLLLRVRSQSGASYEQLSRSLGGTPDSLYGKARRAMSRLHSLLTEDASDA